MKRVVGSYRQSMVLSKSAKMIFFYSKLIQGQRKKNNFLLKITNVVIDRGTTSEHRTMFSWRKKRIPKKDEPKDEPNDEPKNKKNVQIHSDGSFWMPTRQLNALYTHIPISTRKKKKPARDWKTKNPHSTWRTWMGF